MVSLISRERRLGEKKKKLAKLERKEDSKKKIEVKKDTAGKFSFEETGD
jgi:hypothetical protein